MLLREWAAVKYPGYFLREQVRVGPTHESVVGVTIPPALAAALKNWNWYCDGLIVLPDSVLIIEAKVHPDPGAVGQVLFYREIAIGTPELAPLLALPWYPVVLWAEIDDGLNKWAQKFGVRVEVYTPQWIADYLQSVQLRHRRSVSSMPVAVESE